LAFVANAKYRSQLATTRAAAVIVAPAQADATTLPKLLHANPYAAYASAAAVLYPALPAAARVHPAAVVAASAQVDPSAAVGPHAVIGAGARIGARAQIGAGCVLGADV